MFCILQSLTNAVQSMPNAGGLQTPSKRLCLIFHQQRTMPYLRPFMQDEGQDADANANTVVDACMLVHSKRRLWNFQFSCEADACHEMQH